MCTHFPSTITDEKKHVSVASWTQIRPFYWELHKIIQQVPPPNGLRDEDDVLSSDEGGISRGRHACKGTSGPWGDVRRKVN